LRVANIRQISEFLIVRHNYNSRFERQCLLFRVSPAARSTSAMVKPRRQLLPKARGRLSPYIGHKVGKSGLPKSTIIANGLDSGDLGNDPCGKHSLQVAAALLGNIW
jgi:hypothetical protein